MRGVRIPVPGMTFPTSVRAAAGALPFLPRSDRLPDRVVRSEITIDKSRVADYAAVTGLRYRDTVPLTYPFVLTFPAVMSLLTGFDFPFPAVGAVHVENHITASRPIGVHDTLEIRVHAENLREHRKGLLADVISEVSVGNEPAWHQVSTFLHQQRTSLSDEPKPQPAPQRKLPAPKAVLHVTPAQIRRYAAVSGDRNPIHTSALGARLFGFPAAIAHGMYGAAAVLANIEGRLADRVTYDVRFGRPMVLPANPALYIERIDGGWDIALRNISAGYPYLTAELRALP